MWSQVFFTTAVGIVTALIAYVWGRHRYALQRRFFRRDPVYVHIEQDPDIIYANDPNWVSFPYFFPRRTPEEVPEPPSGKCTAWWKWAKEHGGEPAGSMELQVTVTAWSDLQVIVDALRVQVVNTPAPPEGTTVVCPVGGADLVHRQLAVTLSTFATTVVPREGGSYDATGNFAFTLAPGESTRFSLCVSPGDEDVDCYEWVALLDLLVNNERKTVRVTDAGRPFVLHTRGFEGAYHHDGDRWQAFSF